MKKILTSCSMLAIIAGCTSAFAGGPDRFAVAEPPPPVDFFSGFTVGVIGSFWDTKFDVDAAGKIACSNLLPSQTAVDVDGVAVVSISETCVTPGFSVTFDESLTDILEDTGVLFTNLPATGAEAVPAIAFTNNNGDGNDQTGAIGIQASFGKVFPGATWAYYLGIYGGGQWGEGSDNITSEVDLNAFNVGSVLTNIFSALNLSSDDLKIAGRLNTCVEMENVYDVGAQLGVLLTPQTMGYIKGGAAWSEISTATTISARFPTIDSLNGTLFGVAAAIGGVVPIFVDTGVSLFNDTVDISGRARASASDTKLGFEVGFGLSQAFTENFIFSLEYMYRDFGNVSAGRGDVFVPFDLRTANINSGLTASTILTGPLADVDINVTVNKEITTPLTYQVTQSSVRVHQSVVNAILSYRFGSLFQ